MGYFWNALSSDGNNFNLLLFLAALALKATLLLGFVALLCLVFFRSSAATRHMLWALSLCAVLLFPFLSVVKVWEVPILPARISSPAASQPKESARTGDDALITPETHARRSMETSAEADGGGQRIHDSLPQTRPTGEALPATNPSGQPQTGAAFFSKLANWALAVWLAGVLLLLLRLLVGYTATVLLTRRATEFKDPTLVELFSSLLIRLQLKSKVRLLRSERTMMPVVCGVLRPVVLLPAEADDWSEERKGVVLLHELTHVSRRDCLTQMLAQAACAIYWFNPFVWYAARRLRVEREKACDDFVLSIGTKPSDYAHHLLEIARSLRERSTLEWSQATTVAMARKSQLEGRLLAILSKEGKRRTMSQVMAAGVWTLMCGLFLSLALVQPTAGSTQGPHFNEVASVAVTSDSEEPSSGPFLTAYSKSGCKSSALSEKSQEPNREKEGSAPQQYSNTEAGQDAVGNVIEDAAHPVENVPIPTVAPAIVLPPDPFAKVEAPQGLKAVEQDKSGDYIDEMASVGYTKLSVDELIHLKNAGVTADYVRALRALGLNSLAPKELAALANNSITPDYIKAMRSAGYNDLSVRELISFGANGITTEYIKSLRDAGYSNLPSNQLIAFIANDISPSFISGIRAAGYGNLLPRDLITLRANDITPEFIRKARGRLGDLTLQQIISLKVTGIMKSDEDKD